MIKIMKPIRILRVLEEEGGLIIKMAMRKNLTREMAVEEVSLGTIKIIRTLMSLVVSDSNKNRRRKKKK